MHEKLSPLFNRVKAFDPWQVAVAVLLLTLLVALAVRADDEYRWSDWGFGDAQTMLSLRQWEEGGWIHNYLLFKPQGYAPVIDLLDDPELRQHAHGTCPGSSPRIGPRLLYTHYPAGYLVPYAVLFKVGLDSLFSVRMLSILMSVGALALMYAVFARITSPRVSFLAVLFYSLAPAFLGYADSIANQPVDDLLRFGFMLAVVLSTRAESELLRKRWAIAAWVAEFCLSLVSFDSVFFLFTWLIGWDLLERRGFRWKTYFLYGMAPTLAHGLQFLQNVWYLGWGDAFIDIKDAFLLKHGADQGYNTGQGRLATILTSVVIVFDGILRPGLLLAGLLLLYAFYRVLPGRGDRELPSLGLLGVLFLSGLSFILVLPHAARMPYEARQMLPLVALLVSGLTWSLLPLFGRVLRRERTDEAAAAPAVSTGVAAAYLLVGTALSLTAWYGFAVSERSPVYALGPAKEEMKFAQVLTELGTAHAPVYFDVGAFTSYWDPNYVPGYPQILPLTEYYAGSAPILCFRDLEKAAEDIERMVRKSTVRFSPVLVAQDPQHLETALKALKQKGVLTSVPKNTRTAMGRYAVDITDFVNWERK